MTVVEREIVPGSSTQSELSIISRAALAAKDTTRIHRVSIAEAYTHIRLTMHGGWLVARRPLNYRD